MAPPFRKIQACGAEAFADFSWRDYAPFAWILAAEFLFLILALNLGSTVGMATAGRLALLISGDGATHYPISFVHMPAVFAYVETGTYTILGALVLPLAVARLLVHFDPSLGPAATRVARVREAILPTFAGLLACLAILISWQWATNQGVAPAIRMFLGTGFSAIALTWAISVLVGYAVVALAYYVPIAALRQGGGFGSSLGRGARDGLRLLPATFMFLFVFSVPALVVQAIVMFFPDLIVLRMRPELIGILLFLYAALTSLATYLSYSAAVRLHTSETEGA